MSLGKNLQFLRSMHNGMTQEELSEKMGVSRQTISKWEMDRAFPEMEKTIQLSQLFNCTLDELVRGDMDSGNEAYSNIRVEKLEEFAYVRYAVISENPEDDANTHMMEYAKKCGIKDPVIVGWDFPFVSQEQINVFHMHGYCTAWILPADKVDQCKEKIIQKPTKYAIITIKDPFVNPFAVIPNAYKTLFRYIEVNGMQKSQNKEVIECFEKVYEIDGATYMDVYIAIN